MKIGRVLKVYLFVGAYSIVPVVVVVVVAGTS